MLAKLKGFTLIELLIVLLILGILASIATPAYLRYIHRARCSEAVAVMGMIRQAEREHFAKHNSYLDVASGDLPNDPEATTNPGLDIPVGTAQYFSNDAYVVDVGGSFSGNVSNFSAVDFVVRTDGGDSVLCTGNLTDCAVRANDAGRYELEMDNSGRIYVSYDNATSWAGW